MCEHKWDHLSFVTPITSSLCFKRAMGQNLNFLIQICQNVYKGKNDSVSNASKTSLCTPVITHRIYLR